MAEEVYSYSFHIAGETKKEEGASVYRPFGATQLLKFVSLSPTP